MVVVGSIEFRIKIPASNFFRLITGIILSTKFLFPQMIFKPRLGSFIPNLVKTLTLTIPLPCEGVFGSRVCVSPSSTSATSFSQFMISKTSAAPLSSLTSSSSVNVKVMSSSTVVDGSNVKLLNQNEAIQVDQDLFNEYKFSVDQLMELAGLSVATAVAQVYDSKKAEKVLIITGPGNNGGDGLVVARHLKLFGFDNVTILNARKPSKELFINLLHQASKSDVEITYDAESVRQDKSVGLIVDALFGFSFKPPVRPDFQPLVDLMVAASANSIPVVAVDIPSGWDVEKGPPTDQSIRYMPDMLVSLTAPKKCASFFEGTYHFIGGRFVPKKLADKYSLNLPSYPGTDCIVRVK